MTKGCLLLHLVLEADYESSDIASNRKQQTKCPASFVGWNLVKVIFNGAIVILPGHKCPAL